MRTLGDLIRDGKTFCLIKQKSFFLFLNDLKIMLTFSHRRKKLGKLVSHNFANDTLVDWAGCKVHNVEQ